MPSPAARTADSVSGGTLPKAAGKQQQREYSVQGGPILHQPILGAEEEYAANGTRSSAYHSPNPGSRLAFEPSTTQAEDYLRTYRQLKSRHFPLLDFPATMSAQQLRQERPFLWLCIMAVSSLNSSQYDALGKEIRLTIGREMLLESKNNLDLLQGMLIYVSW